VKFTSSAVMRLQMMQTLWACELFGHNGHSRECKDRIRLQLLRLRQRATDIACTYDAVERRRGHVTYVGGARPVHYMQSLVTPLTRFRLWPLTVIFSPISRFAIVHFLDRQTDRHTHRPTDGPLGDMSTPLALTLAVLIKSDALIVLQTPFSYLFWND